MLKKFLDDHKVKYNVKMADEDQAVAEELYEKSGQLGVPFSLLTNENGEEVEKILGFDVQKINRLLQEDKLELVKA